MTVSHEGSAGVGANFQLVLMLVLTFATGVADAVGYLALDRVFTGNMTGNVVILGMGMAGAEDLPIVGPAVALVTFMAGALVGGRALRGHPHGWQRTTTWLLVLVGAVFAGVAGYLALTGSPSADEQRVVAGCIAWAMGLQAATARRVAVKDVTTVVVTSTITSLASDSWLGSREKQPWPRRVIAVTAIGMGALTGALLLQLHIAVAVALASLLIWAVAVVGGRRLASELRRTGSHQ